MLFSLYEVIFFVFLLFVSETNGCLTHKDSDEINDINQYACTRYCLSNPDNDKGTYNSNIETCVCTSTTSCSSVPFADVRRTKLTRSQKCTLVCRSEEMYLGVYIETSSFIKDKWCHCYKKERTRHIQLIEKLDRFNAAQYETNCFNACKERALAAYIHLSARILCYCYEEHHYDHRKTYGSTTDQLAETPLNTTCDEYCRSDPDNESGNYDCNTYICECYSTKHFLPERFSDVHKKKLTRSQQCTLLCRSKLFYLGVTYNRITLKRGQKCVCYRNKDVELLKLEPELEETLMSQNETNCLAECKAFYENLNVYVHVAEFFAYCYCCKRNSNDRMIIDY